MRKGSFVNQMVSWLSIHFGEHSMPQTSSLYISQKVFSVSKRHFPKYPTTVQNLKHDHSVAITQCNSLLRCTGYLSNLGSLSASTIIVQRCENSIIKNIRYFAYCCPCYIICESITVMKLRSRL